MKNIHTSSTHVISSKGFLVCELGNGDTLKAKTLEQLKSAIVSSLEKIGVTYSVVVEEYPANLPSITLHFLRIHYSFK